MAPMKKHWSLNIRIIDKDKKQLDVLRAQGHTIVAIFRKGLETLMNERKTI